MTLQELAIEQGWIKDKNDYTSGLPLGLLLELTGEFPDDTPEIHLVGTMESNFTGDSCGCCSTGYWHFVVLKWKLLKLEF